MQGWLSLRTNLSKKNILGKYNGRDTIDEEDRPVLSEQ
jgi:hypothetical protein